MSIPISQFIKKFIYFFNERFFTAKTGESQKTYTNRKWFQHITTYYS